MERILYLVLFGHRSYVLIGRVVNDETTEIPKRFAQGVVRPLVLPEEKNSHIGGPVAQRGNLLKKDIPRNRIAKFLIHVGKL